MLKKKERRVPIGNRLIDVEYPRLDFQQALDFVINAKRSEGLRDRTLMDYRKHYRYFYEILRTSYQWSSFFVLGEGADLYHLCYELYLSGSFENIVNL